ncbi:MAG: Ig-like domain-containing protein [Paenibacillaceae bacterium]
MTLSVYADSPGYTVTDGDVYINEKEVSDSIVDNGGNFYTFEYIVEQGDLDRSVLADLPVSIILRNGTGPSVAFTDAVIGMGTLDAHSPVVNTLSPSNGQYPVSLNNTILVMNFNENVTAVAGKFINILDDGGNSIFNRDTTDGAINTSGNTVTITHGLSFVNSGQYKVFIDKGAFIDNHGNEFAGIDNAQVYWEFSIESAISATLAADNSYVDLTFSEGVYGTNDFAGPINLNQLNLIFDANGDLSKDVTIDSISKTDGNPLLGGETIVRVHLNITGKMDGSETLEIKPIENPPFSIYGGHTLSEFQDTQSTGVFNLNALITRQQQHLRSVEY